MYVRSDPCKTVEDPETVSFHLCFLLRTLVKEISGDMLVCVIHFCLVYVVCLSHEIDNYKSGWIPTSSDKVNSLFKRSDMRYPIIDINAEAIHVLNNNLIRFKTTDVENEKEATYQKGSEYYNSECKEPVETNCSPINEDNPQQSSQNYFTPNNNQEKLEKTDISNPSKPNQLRRAKEISEDVISNMIFKDIKTKLETDNKNLPDSKEVEVVEENRNNYEVTEHHETDTPNTKPAASELGYQYKPPKETKLNGHNLTNAFLTILSKHNIGTNDHLSNYDLSLRYKNNQALPKDQLAFTPGKLLYRYNSLNHLPVNPLLAVLLSNYGYYVPGLYGIQSNYNNLYGYLASNNIHNNRPFGFYKISSDTDSSNK